MRFLIYASHLLVGSDPPASKIQIWSGALLLKLFPTLST